ncbi:uncharacterized protein OCT59_025794 [Rhizophagus irregularis]|uniref:uncharacterized protein n=1 Tax=Rhizophagus irregularis TaxID=588596 RepID=UPI00331EB5D7|nr:hypothetical protein OCT59_025794 [Rhizophagus irregularis]
MEPIKDIGIRRFRMEPIKDIGIQRFWMEPIDDFEIRRFRMEPIDDFWNSEVLDAEEQFWTFILKVLDAKVLDAKVRLQTSWTPKPAPDFTLKIKEAETEFRAPISKVKEAERTSISKVQPYKKLKGRFRSPILKHSGRFVGSISKVQDAESTCLRFNFEGPGRRRTLISKVSGSPEFSWTEFQDFWLSGFSLDGIFNMFSGSHLDWTGFQR